MKLFPEFAGSGDSAKNKYTVWIGWDQTPPTTTTTTTSLPMQWVTNVGDCAVGCVLNFNRIRSFQHWRRIGLNARFRIVLFIVFCDCFYNHAIVFWILIQFDLLLRWRRGLHARLRRYLAIAAKYWWRFLYSRNSLQISFSTFTNSLMNSVPLQFHCCL